MKPNIFLITIDALRSDYIYKKNENLHPFISELMDKSIVFKNVISPGPATATSFPALFTDLSPLEARKGEGRFNEIPPQTTTLAEKFKNLGYYTAGFSNNAHLTRIQGYDRGFDHFFDGIKNKEKSSEESLKIKKKIVKSLKNSLDPKFKRGKFIIGPILALLNERGYEPFTNLLKRIKKFMKSYSGDKPLFLWTHLMEVHSPYNLPSIHFSEIGEKTIPNWEQQWLRHKRHNSDCYDGNYLFEKEMEKIKVLYRCGIKDVDTNLRLFFDYLKENGYLENGCFTITADHGENLGEHGLTTHSYIYNSVLKVPLIVHDGIDKGSINEIFSNSDLGQLLMDHSKGHSIKERIKKYSKPVISEREGDIFSIQNKKYIMS